MLLLDALNEKTNKNGKKSEDIMALYARLNARVLELTHSQCAVPLVDVLFIRPVIRSSEIRKHRGMPSTPMVMNMIGKLKDDGILTVVRAGSGRRAQVLALKDLINLCEGRKVFK